MSLLTHTELVELVQQDIITAAAWKIHGMEQLLLAMGEDAEDLGQVSDALSRLSNEPRDGYSQALARLRNDLEASHG